MGQGATWENPSIKNGKSMNNSIANIVIFLMFVLCSVWTGAKDAVALEGDWEVGMSPGAVIMPSRDIYGGGAELFARYSVLDGLDIGVGAGAYGAHHGDDGGHALGIYSVRAGVMYALDILQWVPRAGVHISSIFSEDDRFSWHRGGHGMGIDFDIQVQYRGIRHVGIGVFFGYRLVFTDHDMMLAGLTVSWISGEF